MNSSLVYKHIQRISNCNWFLHFYGRFIDSTTVTMLPPPRAPLAAVAMPAPRSERGFLTAICKGGREGGEGFPPD